MTNHKKVSKTIRMILNKIPVFYMRWVNEQYEGIKTYFKNRFIFKGKSSVKIRRVYEYLNAKNALVFMEKQDKTYLAAPLIVNDKERKFKSGLANLPDEYVGILQNVSLVGGTRIIISPDGELLHDELVSFPSTDYGIKTPGNIRILSNGRAVIRAKKSFDNEVDTGNLISCEHDENYFHWLIECLPKLLMVNSLGQFKDAPILISENLHPNLLCALEKINRGSRKIIELKRGRVYNIKKLIYPSDLSRLLDREHGEILFDIDAVLSPKWIRAVTQELTSSIVLPTEKPWRKIYLTRHSRVERKLINEAELELALTYRGFEIVDLSECSLDYQMVLFRQAKLIVAPTGAALTNIIFCLPNTKVIVLTSDHKRMPFQIFNQLANIAGLSLQFCVGKRCYTREDVHDDYTISIERIVQIIKDICK